MKRRLSLKSPVLPPSSTIASVPCRISSYTIRRNEMTSTRSSNDPVKAPVSTRDSLLRDPTSDNPIIPPLRNLIAAKDTVRLVPGNHSGLPHCQQPVSGTQGEHGAWPSTPYGSQHENQESCAPALGCAVSCCARVRDPGLTRHSPSGLDSVTGERSGADDRGDSSYHHQPVSIVITSLHGEEDVLRGRKLGRQPAI